MKTERLPLTKYERLIAKYPLEPNRVKRILQIVVVDKQRETYLLKRKNWRNAGQRLPDGDY